MLCLRCLPQLISCVSISVSVSVGKEHLCSSCAARPLCLPMGLSESDVHKLEKIVVAQSRLKTKEHLFIQQDHFKCFYAVRSGSFKKYLLTEDGREQVADFYFPGEFIGLDAVDTGIYDCSVMALEPSEVCEIPFDMLLSTAAQIPSLQRQMIKLMSQRLKHRDAIPINSHAIEKIASFLLNISMRIRRYRTDETGFMLAMSRQEIGCYLGLAVETVSRIFSKLNRDAVITTQGKKVVINDFRQLQRLSICNSY